jgi:hypothetical protein
MNHEVMQVLQLIMPVFGGLTLLMCSMIGYIGSKVYDKLSEMSNHLVSIKEELRNEINSIERRVIRLESVAKMKDEHFFHDRLNDDNH